jgi:hypothetical protein
MQNQTTLVASVNASKLFMSENGRIQMGYLFSIEARAVAIKLFMVVTGNKLESLSLAVLSSLV